MITPIPTFPHQGGRSYKPVFRYIVHLYRNSELEPEVLRLKSQVSRLFHFNLRSTTGWIKAHPSRIKAIIVTITSVVAMMTG
jgi:hypothetical protein